MGFDLVICGSTIAAGVDADIAIWYPDRHVRVKGRELTGWPVTVLSRGEVIVEDGKLHAARGRGQFLAREHSEALRPLGR